MIPLPNAPKIVNQQENEATIEIKPLYPGYGVTVANTYRRVLLSSLEGGAIVKANIEGVDHEFSTIEGILEDVVEILLNLKKINFKTFSDEPQTITLEEKGEGKIKAKDFDLSSQVEIANPDAHIATITKKGRSFSMEATVEKGEGYIVAEDKKEEDEEASEIGTLYLDASFSPVKRVSFDVENVRVGKKTDFEAVKLNIKTNGVVSPKEALQNATEILLDHFNVFDKFGKEEEIEEAQVEEEKEAEEEEEESKKEKRKTKIEELDIPKRAKNVLSENSIRTLGGLLRKSKEDIKDFEGLGQKTFEKLEKTIKDLGFELKE